MGDSPEVAEIRIAVLDEVKKKIQRAGGQALFPYNVVRIADSRRERRTAPFSSATSSAGSSMKKCARIFRRKHADFRRICGLRFGATNGEGQVAAVRDAVPKTSPPLPRRSASRAADREVGGLRREPPIRPRSPCKSAHQYRPAHATFTNPKACRAATIWRLPRTLAINRTVSREHAHIVHDKKTGEYRLFNDRWYTRAIRPRTTAGYGSSATAWDRKCIAIRAGRACSRGMRFISAKRW